MSSSLCRVAYRWSIRQHASKAITLLILMRCILDRWVDAAVRDLPVPYHDGDVLSAEAPSRHSAVLERCDLISLSPPRHGRALLSLCRLRKVISRTPYGTVVGTAIEEPNLVFYRQRQHHLASPVRL